MVRFHLTVLGTPHLYAADGGSASLRTRKHFALLIYLVLEPPVPHRRDRLATLLWPRTSIDDARHSLAVALSAIRARLGRRAIEGTRDAVRLAPGLVTTDLSALRQSPRKDQIEQIGPFLREFQIDDAPDFQQWREAQHTASLPLIHRLFDEEISEARQRGDTERMEMLAQRLQRIDELNEMATRVQIEVRAMTGDRTGALRVYERWQGRLFEELGAFPAPHVTRLVDRVRDNRWSAGVAAEAAELPVAARPQPFMGRRAEFETAYQAWEETRRGKPLALIVRGESGVGKTTLIERATGAMSLEGAAVVRAPCFHLERELPFAVAISAVNGLLMLPGAAGTAPEFLAELSRMIPAIRERYTGLPAPRPITGARDRVRTLFAEALTALITSVAEDQPVVLVVDDVHLADVTSLAVLHRVMRDLRGSRVLTIFTSSSTPGDESIEARHFVAGVAALDARSLHLEALTEEQAFALLVALLGEASVSETVKRSLLSAARGNPMVLGLLVQDWQRAGDQSVALSLGAMTTTSTATLATALRQVIERTMGGLDPDVRAVAQLGALLGRRLNDVAMYQLVDMPAARTTRAMTALAGQRILRDAGNALEFTNEFVRSQCYHGMAAPLRRMLHGAVADRLLAQDPRTEAIPGLELAWHLVRAGRLDEAVPYLLRGAREAIERTAPHEAELALSTGLPALKGDARRKGRRLLAESQQEMGRWEDSLAVVQARAGDADDEHDVAAEEVFRIIAELQLGRVEPTELRGLTDELFRVAVSNNDIDVRVQALAESVRLLTLTRDSESIERLHTLASQLVPMEMNAYSRLYLLFAKAWPLYVQQDTNNALTIVHSAIALADQHSIASSIVARLLVGEGCLRITQGHYHDSLTQFSRADAIAQKLGNKSLLANCASQIALAEGRLGNHAQQVAHARVATATFAAKGWNLAELGAKYELALGLAFLGKHSEAQAQIGPVVDRHTTMPDWAKQVVFLCAADIYAIAGNRRRAFCLARKATQGNLQSLLSYSFAGQFARWVALLAVKHGTVRHDCERLAATFPNRHSFDLKDQAEVLFAQTALENQCGNDCHPAWMRVHQELGNLPQFVSTLMRRLGLAELAPNGILTNSFMP